MRKTLAILLIGSGLVFGGAGFAAAQSVPTGSYLPVNDDDDDPAIVELWAELMIAAIGQDEWDRITGDGR